MKNKLNNSVSEIKFYSLNDEYGEFSNFAKYPIKIGGKIWPTTEHFFQSQKFAGTKYENEVRKLKRPIDAARMGRDRTLPLRRDWETAKIGIMKTALILKFTQYEDLKTLLLNTKDAILIEHTENDDFWGDGGDGKGKNMLGKLLMEIRELLRSGKI